MVTQTGNSVRQTFTSIVPQLSANHRLARVIFTPSSCCRSVAIADARTDRRLLLRAKGQGRRQWMSRHLIASGQTAYACVSSFFSVLLCCIHPSYSLDASCRIGHRVARTAVVLHLAQRLWCKGGLSRQKMHVHTREEVRGRCVSLPQRW